MKTLPVIITRTLMSILDLAMDAKDLASMGYIPAATAATANQRKGE